MVSEGADVAPGAIAAKVFRAVPELAVLSPAVQGAFGEAFLRHVTGTSSLDSTDEQLHKLARDLWTTVTAPLQKWGFREPSSNRGRTDYMLAMLHALMLAMPAEGEGEPLPS
jgi:hypothetical protein